MLGRSLIHILYGEVIRLAFISKRLIVLYATGPNPGISGSEIRDIMLEAAEKHLRATGAQPPLNICPTTEAPTLRSRLFAQGLNPIPFLLHARRKPKVKGRVGGFRQNPEARLYADLTHSDADTALRNVDGWINDQSEIRPHSATSRQYVVWEELTKFRRHWNLHYRYSF